jgi:hypothetical protein
VMRKLPIPGADPSQPISQSGASEVYASVLPSVNLVRLAKTDSGIRLRDMRSQPRQSHMCPPDCNQSVTTEWFVELLLWSGFRARLDEVATLRPEAIAEVGIHERGQRLGDRSQECAGGGDRVRPCRGRPLGASQRSPRVTVSLAHASVPFAH